LNAGTNAISQSGAILVDDGAVSLSGGTITLEGANILGAVTVTSGSGTVSLIENDGVTIAGIDRTDGDLTINAGSNSIAQSGAILVDDGRVSLSGGAITLEEANVLGAVTVSYGAGVVSLTENDSIAVSGITRTDGDLTLNAGTNSIEQSGAILVDDGGVSLSGGAITLQGANIFGTVTVNSGAGTVSLTEDDAISVAGITRTDGDLSLNAGTNAISQTGIISVDDGTVSITSGSLTLDLDNTLGSTSLNVGGDATVKTVSALSLQGSVAGQLSATATAGGISEAGTLTVTGASTFDAGTAALTLDDATSSYGDLVVTASDAIIKEADSVTASSIQATNLQVSANSGISITANGVENFAAQTESGDISFVNVGGYSVESFAVDGGVEGVSFTDGSATGTISLIAEGPLSINAPIDAKGGSLVLAASGTGTTDDLTINSELTAASATLYAGDSINLSNGAVFSTSDTVLWLGTNFDSSDSSVSLGSADGTLSIVKGVKLPASIMIKGVGRTPLGFDSKARIIKSSYEQMVDYSNAMNPLLEETSTWENIKLLGFLPDRMSDLLAPQNSGQIETEEE